MSSVGDSNHNKAYHIVCPHPTPCDFGCTPIDGKYLLTMEEYEDIKRDDNLREQFKKASADAYGKIQTVGAVN